MWLRQADAWEEIQKALLRPKGPFEHRRMYEQEARTRRALPRSKTWTVPVQQFISDPKIQEQMTEEAIKRSVEIPKTISELLSLPTGALQETARKSALTSTELDYIDQMLDSILAEL